MDDTSVIILDTIGELAHLYSLATVVFVGGSLVPAGGHNILEPAIYSKPILFGPYMGNFEEVAKAFLEKDASRQVSDSSQLEEGLRFFLSNINEARLIGERARDVVEENRGAVRRSLSMIRRFI